MNKFAFLSGMLTLLLLFFQFIPLGIMFGSNGANSNWVLTYFGLTLIPLLNNIRKFHLK